MGDRLDDTFEITLFKSTTLPFGFDWLDNTKQTYLFAPKDQFVE